MVSNFKIFSKWISFSTLTMLNEMNTETIKHIVLQHIIFGLVTIVSIMGYAEPLPG